ncbi:MAG TPA: YbaK/EbsC family protein [Actinomycetota bacterium]|nr:YbaK/EbsC family protein [Actinomycetota bacterium]
MMSSAIDRFLREARRRGIEPDVQRFPAGTKTADDAARAIGCDVGQIVKSLVFVGSQGSVLALTSGRNRVDTARLARAAGGATVRRATPDEARSATGFAVGGTPPFVVSTEDAGGASVAVLVDETLLGYDEVWAAAGTPDAVFPIAPADLVAASGGSVASFAER